MVDGKNRMLSKSQINTWVQCPYRWKLRYIDKAKSIPGPALMKGIRAHKQIEQFYDNIKDIKTKDGKTIIELDATANISLIDNFKKFEERRYESCKDNPDKYFKPLFQELKLRSEELKLQGALDAVYINPKDDGIIIIDWKTGKYRPDYLSEYRFELSIYKELFEKEKNQKVKYWGVYFVDADKLFFEEVKEASTKAMKKKVQKTRDGITKAEYPMNVGVLCKWCEFQEVCPAWQ